jgi:FtsH-binding integral membrane protein
MFFNNNRPPNDYTVVESGHKLPAEVQAGKTMAGIYGWMSFGVAVSAACGVGLLGTGALGSMLNAGFPTFLVFIAQIALVLVMSFAANKLSASTLKALFLAYSAMTGFTFAVIMAVYPIGNVIGIFAVAAIGFLALALYGATTKRSLGFMGTFLMMGLFMIIGASILNMFIHSDMLRSFTGWIGILVFSGLTAYDSQRLRQESYALASTGAENVMQARFMILGALTMYLNFINLFISLLQVFGGRRD